jgi:5S rRNA maturation endonuclease (ribonuclease M5)
MNPIDLEAYLLGKGLRVKRSGTQLYTTCVFCHEAPEKRGRLYLDDASDETRGLYFCFLCNEKGNIHTLRKHFGDPPLDDEQSLRGDRSRRILSAATQYYASNLTDEVRSYLRTSRGLTDETIEKFQFGWASRGSNLARHLKDLGFEWDEILATGLAKVMDGKKVADFFQDVIVFPYLVAGSPVQIRCKEIGGKYRTPPGQPARLFNTDAVWGAKEVILCEGEIDAMSLTQIGYHAVAVPGAAIWQDPWNGYFDGANRVFIMYDPDEVGQTNSLKVTEALGAKAKNVVLPVPEDRSQKEVDPNWLIANQHWGHGEFRAVLDDAIWANSLLVSPREAQQEWQSIQGVEGFQFGFEYLDNALRPGFLPGQVCVPLAKTNAGKTVLLLNIFQRAAMVKGQEDVKILFVSLEQTRGDWFERARRIWNFYNLDCDPGDVNQETINYWDRRLRLVDKNRVTPDEFRTILAEYEEQMGSKPDLVAVDYLGYWARAFPGRDRYTQVGDAVMELKGIAKEFLVPILAPHQVNRSAEFGEEFSIDQARDSGAIEETADFVMSMWNPDSLKGNDKSRTGKINFAIGKSRHGGKGKKLVFQFGYMTLVVVPSEDPLSARRATNEAGWSMDTRLDWTDAIRAHATGTTPQGSGPPGLR